jgi:solute carrier family 15 (oligopeptide transporter), member 1
LIIAIGTGGIKPCVSAFGGDQFVRPQQDRQLEQFFSIFYMSINAGSLISTLLTPILRENVKCFDQNTCFPLAFGVPAVLMTTAVGKCAVVQCPTQIRPSIPNNEVILFSWLYFCPVVFVVGKSKYKMNPPEGNVMLDVAKCIGVSVLPINHLGLDVDTQIY